MQHVYKPSAIALALVLLPATPDIAIADNDILDPVVVSASRQPQLVSETLASAIVIEREQIERAGGADVGDILRFHAGLDVVRSGGPGQQTSLFMRGTNSDHTLVLVNGVRINSATTGGAAWQNIRPGNIERIEVVKGPRSAIHGSDAIGGVVNIITRAAPEGHFLEAEAGAGRYGTREGRVATGIRQGDTHMSAGIDVSDTDGFPVREDENDDRGHDNTTLTFNAGTRLGGVQVEGDIWQSTGTNEYSAFGGVERSQDYRNQTTRIAVSGAPHDLLHSRLALSRADDNLQQNDSDTFSHTRRYSADWQNDLVLTADNRLTVGAFFEREDVDSTSFGDTETDTASVYAENALETGPHRLTVAGRHADHDDFGTRNTWNVEYGLHVTERTRLSAGVGTAFQTPTVADRFGVGGNPDLKPETSRNMELGVHHRIDSNRLLTASAFYNEVEDLITLEVDASSPTGFTAENVEEALIRGVEVAYVQDWNQWRVRGEAILQNPENRDTRQQLARRAERTATLSVTRSFGDHWLNLNALRSGGSEDFAGDLPSYTLVNASGRYQFDHNWSITARLDNVFDEDYFTASADNAPQVFFNNPGRSFFATLRYEIN